MALIIQEENRPKDTWKTYKILLQASLKKEQMNRYHIDQFCYSFNHNNKTGNQQKAPHPTVECLLVSAFSSEVDGSSAIC